MFQTKFGARALMHQYSAAELASNYGNPTVGQCVVLKAPVATQPFFKPASRGKKKLSEVERYADINAPSDPDLGKLQLASAAGSGSGELDGVIVQVIRKSATVLDSVVVAPPGEEVPLWIFGNLAKLQSLGAGNILYLSVDTPGDVQNGNIAPGNFARKVARVPKFFANLTAADLDPQNVAAIYVQIIEERPLTT